jgi:hypothetical protein
MSSTKGTIFGKGGLPDGQSPNADVVGMKSTNLFERGVVIDTICDVSVRDAPPETLSEPQQALFALAPRNSIICRIVTTKERLSVTSDVVCFPFFSSHFALPVKAGEQVWVFRQKAFTGDSSDRLYWMSRVSDILPIEDANFAPFTRPWQLTQEKAVPPDRELTVPNGGAENVEITGDDLALQQLTENSLEAGNFVLEPVPRITKRPGDLVIQGSNNALICLGTDRGWDAADRPDQSKNSNAILNAKQTENAGSIDVVVGRGRYFKPSADEIKRDRAAAASSLGVKNSTQPFIAANSFGKFETDKDPGQTQPVNGEQSIDGSGPAAPGNSKTNPAEGDPDFLVDAARIYVSANTEIDKRLGLDKIIPAGFAAVYGPMAGPTVAIKADHVRIVARKVPLKATDGTLPEKFEAAAGSIRIVKEGNNDEDLASIIIEPDGTIQITGPKIFLGRTADDGGPGIGPGPGKSQPYVKYKELEDLWNETMDTLTTFCDTLLTHVTPGYGAPSPQLNKAAADLKAKIGSKLKKDIETLKSKRIFGE